MPLALGRKSDSEAVRACVARGGVAGPSKSAADCSPRLAAVAGAMAGGIVTAILHPLDTVKVLIQAGRQGDRRLSTVLLHNLRARGVSFLYSGLAPSVAASVPISAVYTFTYEATKRRMERRMDGRHAWLAQCCSGAAASVATSFIYTPTECVKAQLQVGNYSCPRSAVAGMLKGGGPLSLLRGWGAVLCRNIPQSVIKFTVFEQLQARVTDAHDSGEQRTVKSLACGAAAATTGACVTTPIDVIKTRIQTQGSVGGAADTLRMIVREESLLGLYRGLLPRLGIYMTQGAIFFTAYGALKHSLHVAEMAAQRDEAQGSGGVRAASAMCGGGSGGRAMMLGSIGH